MKNKVEVVIAGNRFTMTGEQDEEYMTKIAGLIDDRVSKIRENGMNLVQAVTLTACDMADNYVQAVRGAEDLRSQISSYLDKNKILTQELEDAQKEIDTLQKRTEDYKNKSAGQFQERIIELEQQLEAAKADKKHITELEKQLTEANKGLKRMGELEKQLAKTQTRANLVSGLEKQLVEAQTRVEGMGKLEKQLEEAKKRGERVNELEKQLAAAEAQHRTQTDKMTHEIEQLNQKAEEGKKAQQRVEEMEKELNVAKNTLNEMNTRLSRLFK